VPRNTNVMGYIASLLMALMALLVSSLPYLSSLFLLLLHLSTAHSNPFPFTFQPTIQEHKELVWLAGNLKLEVTQYTRDLYSLGGLAYPDDDNDDYDNSDSDSDND